MAESKPPTQPAGGPRLNVKISDDELKGRYANLVRVSHTREEFILDFINFVPPQGAVTARLMMSPGHIKRLIRALADNLNLYEKAHGDVAEAQEPIPGADEPKVN